MNVIAYGSKYEATKDLPRTEIAKLIREDIKQALKSGALPAGKYSVKCRRYAGGGSIDVVMSDLEIDALHNPARLAWDLKEPHRPLCQAPSETQWLHSARARLIEKIVEGIVAAYNFDGSDPVTDYYNVRFHGDVTFDWKWSNARREIETARITTPFLTKPSVALGTPVNEVEPAPTTNAQEDFIAALGAE